MSQNPPFLNFKFSYLHYNIQVENIFFSEKYQNRRETVGISVTKGNMSKSMARNVSVLNKMDYTFLNYIQ